MKKEKNAVVECQICRRKRFCCNKKQGADQVSAGSSCRGFCAVVVHATAVACNMRLGRQKHDTKPCTMVCLARPNPAFVCRRGAMCVEGQPTKLPSSPFWGFVPSYRDRTSIFGKGEGLMELPLTIFHTRNGGCGRSRFCRV